MKRQRKPRVDSICRTLREAKGLSQKELAAQLEIGQQTVSSYETKDIQTVKALCQLADFYGVSTDYILGRTDEEKPAQYVASSLLSEEELQLVKLYRKLTEEEKTAVLTVINSMRVKYMSQSK